ncbi:hypothetical protein BDD43_3385 [Mucilaginibacter gracilis]|uniref:LysM domain-containing protein n=1 Tax=Mucilaginibacter gracilis TaxID=423350 RepID=A0A495J2X6_9SPHI|nr:hypothetical protein [Mucilaginibacter gracilis]RKR83183.1 hypothetical protein BDD43_3385 [Mucilaginibacter gracilis]
MKQITTESGQSIIDIAMQEYGTPEALVTICADNALEYDADLMPGQSLNIREPGVDVIPYRNDQIVAQYANTVINTHTSSIPVTPPSNVLPCFYGPGAAGLNGAGILQLAVVYKDKKAATLTYTADMQRLYYVYPADQGALTHIYEPGGYDIVSSFTAETVNLTIDGVAVAYIVRCLERDTYLTTADNFILNFI